MPEKEVRAVAHTDDPTKWYLMAQLVASCQEYAQKEAEYEVAIKMRDDAIRRAKRAGLTVREIANIAGLSPARIQQVAPVGAKSVEMADETDDQRAIV